MDNDAPFIIFAVILSFGAFLLGHTIGYEVGYNKCKIDTMVNEIHHNISDMVN